jgi:hypothetical protein
MPSDITLADEIGYITPGLGLYKLNSPEPKWPGDHAIRGIPPKPPTILLFDVRPAPGDRYHDPSSPSSDIVAAVHNQP